MKIQNRKNDKSEVTTMEENEKKLEGTAEKTRNEEYLGKIFTMLKKWRAWR
ncbi:MAG: hypothetical protein ACLR06_15065 [Christensenellaceae bacterium]